MATFTDFSDLLPDPDNKINTAGVQDTTGSAGPGFAKVRFKSNNIDVQSSRTRSGRGVSASPDSHQWEFDISYNPLTREEFDPVSTFLEYRRGPFLPFYVILPQHNKPKDTAFYEFSLVNTIRAVGLHYAGDTVLTIDSSISIVGDPKPGDFFTITDPADANHTKVYKVVRLETPDYYQVGLPVSVGTRRIHTIPALMRDVSDNSVINFIDPKFRVKQRGSTLEYDLDTNNLYEFSLSLEEVQP